MVIVSFIIGCVLGLIVGVAGMCWLFSEAEASIAFLEKQAKE